MRNTVVSTWARCVERTRTSRYARNFLHLVTANVLAQVILLAAAPLLSRLYGPEAFGVFGIFTAIVGVGLAVVTGRLEWLIPNPRSSRRAGALLAIGLIVTVVSCVAISLTLLVTPREVLPTSWQTVADVLWLAPWVLAGTGLLQLLQAWHIRGADLAVLGRAKTFQSIANVGVALAAVWVIGKPAAQWGLIVGMMFGAWAGAFGLWRGSSDIRSALERTSRRRLKLVWCKYQSQIGWSSLAAILNALSLAIVPLLLARHYSVVEVGFYTLTQRIAFIPIGFVSSAARQSFWAEAARRIHSDRSALLELFMSSIRRLWWIAAIVGLAAIAGPLYVGPLFGRDQWEDAGWVLAASAPMLIGQIVASPMSHLEVHGKQHWQAAWDALRILALALALEGAGRAALAFPVAVLAMSLVMGAMYALLLGLNARALRLEGRNET